MAGRPICTRCDTNDFLARHAGGEQELTQVRWTSEDFGSVERALQGLREPERLSPHATRRLLALSLFVGLFEQPAYVMAVDG